MISSPRGILSPTRLAILHYTAPPVIGGVEAILGTHARLLRQAGYDVKVIAGQGGSDPDSKLIPELGSRHPQVEALYQQLGRGEVDRTAFRQLQALLADQLRPLLADRDLVIAHNVLTMPFNLPLAATLAELELPILAWTHDLAWINPRYHNYQRAGYPYDILCQPQPRTTYIAISKLRQQEISKTLGLTSAQISIIPNGVGVADFLGLSSSTRD
ncbi:MAG: glycosyltransferase, partial [Candidatus Dormibacteraceae bacterium]